MRGIVKDMVCVTACILGWLLILGSVGGFENGQATVLETLICIGAGALMSYASWQGVSK